MSIGVLAAGLLAAPALAEEKFVPDYSKWGEGYYAAMWLNDEEFNRDISQILDNFGLDNGRNNELWALYTISDLPKDRYDVIKDNLWAIIMKNDGGVYKNPTVCGYVGNYLPDERYEPSRDKELAQELENCVTSDLDASIYVGRNWTKERFAPISKSAAERVGEGRTGSYSSYWIGIFWSDDNFNLVKDVIRGNIKGRDRGQAKKIWKEERKNLL